MQPVIYNDGRNRRVRENTSQTSQSFFRIIQQPEFSRSSFNRSGLSGNSIRPLSRPLSTEKQPGRWQQSTPHKRLGDEAGNIWIAAAIDELEHIDQEVVEESLPEINAETKKKARKIIYALSAHPIAPTLYPTMDGEIAIYFKSPLGPSSVLILVGNDGDAACFSCIKGKNRRARYEDSSEIPDEFVKEQLRALKRPIFSSF